MSWLLAALVAVPELLVSVQTEERLSTPDVMQNIHRCQSGGFTAVWQRKLYFTFMTSCILIIPTCIMILPA